VFFIGSYATLSHLGNLKLELRQPILLAGPVLLAFPLSFWQAIWVQRLAFCVLAAGLYILMSIRFELLPWAQVKEVLHVAQARVSKDSEKRGC